MNKKIQNIEGPAMFPGGDEDALRAALALTGAEQQAMARLTADGHLAALTAAAKQILGLSVAGSIFERMSEENAALLKDALEKGTPLSFTDHFGAYRLCDVTSAPLAEGALLLLSTRNRQTLLDARVLQVVRNNLGVILMTAAPIDEAVRDGQFEKDAERLQALLENAENPQAVFRAEAAALYERLRQEAARRHSRIYRQVLRIERTLKHADWLQYSKISDAKPIYILDDLAALCRAGADAFSKKCRAQVEVRAPQKLVAAYDPDWMMSALLNLLTNAANAEHITITLARLEGRIMLSVEDDGRGVPPLKLYHLYHAWREEYQPKSYPDPDAEPCPGLGLPLVQLVAARHEGCLLHEELDQSEIFRLCIPDSLKDEPAELRSQSQAINSFSMIDLELSIL